jgi:hypothetical protein
MLPNIVSDKAVNIISPIIIHNSPKKIIIHTTMTQYTRFITQIYYL